MGLDTNNFAELFGLNLLLSLALDKHLTKLQVFGDSQLVINWVFGKYRIQNIQLAQILHEVNRIADILESVEYKHIYRERNSIADVLAKD